MKGLPLKPDLLKGANTKSAMMDDSTETKRKLEKLGDMPDIDMSMPTDESVGENLEVDDDDDEANKLDEENKARAKDNMDLDDDEIDPLDAFMNEVKQEVKKVNEMDVKKMMEDPNYRRRLEDRMNDDDDGPEEEVKVVTDELDATDLNPEDILALAAKKAKKKDLVAVDHSRIAYEPFRKEFYHPPPEVADMTDEDAELLRLELDGIKIRGIDCPRPITKWSHCGLPSSWYV